jgi:hypothetical protein
VLNLFSKKKQSDRTSLNDIKLISQKTLHWYPNAFGPLLAKLYKLEGKNEAQEGSNILETM